jgi:hypothetical protein
MNRYETNTPRLAFGIAAAAMAVITLGFAVILPATTGNGGQEALVAAKAAAPATEVAINPSRIEIVGVREQSVALANTPAQIDMVAARP